MSNEKSCCTTSDQTNDRISRYMFRYLDLAYFCWLNCMLNAKYHILKSNPFLCLLETLGVNILEWRILIFFFQDSTFGAFECRCFLSKSPLYTQYPTVPGVPKIKFWVPTVWPLKNMRTHAHGLRKKKIFEIGVVEPYLAGPSSFESFYIVKSWKIMIFGHFQTQF